MVWKFVTAIKPTVLISYKYLKGDTSLCDESDTILPQPYIKINDCFIVLAFHSHFTHFIMNPLQMCRSIADRMFWPCKGQGQMCRSRTDVNARE